MDTNWDEYPNVSPKLRAAFNLLRTLGLVPTAGILAMIFRSRPVPVWLYVLLMVFGLPMLWTVVLIHRQVARLTRWRAAGACMGCGYDLTGNSSGVCPECGAGTEKPRLK